MAVVVVVVVIALGLTSCHGDGSPSAPKPPSIEAVDLHGPGSPIADGLVVPTRAQLLGRVFHGMTLRGYGGLSSSDGWVAVMTVSTDGQLSFNDLVSQARKVGFVDAYEDLPPHCGGDSQGSMVCSADLTSPKGETVDVESEVGQCGPQGASHLIVSNSPGADLPPPTRTVKRRHLPPTTTTTEPKRPGNAPSSPRLPGPGDLLNPRPGYVIAPVHLEPGSRVVGPPMVSCDFHGVHSSVIQITGPVDRVFDAYAQQFADEATDASVWETTAHGASVKTVVGGMAGGDAWVLTVVEQAHHRTYGLIQTTTDA
jgi:hypothetical protein